MNPMVPPDPYANPMMPTAEQMTFVYTHYPDYTKDLNNITANVVNLMNWLYGVSQYSEQVAM